MKNLSVLVVLVASMLVLLSLAAQADGDGDRDGSFASQVAGAYLTESIVEGEPGSAQTLSTLHADGTVNSSSSSSFTNGFESPAVGEWERIGPRQIRTRTLKFKYLPDGTLEGYVGTDVVATVDLRSATSVGEGYVSFWTADLDPLEDDPVATFPVATTTQRIFPDGGNGGGSDEDSDSSDSSDSSSSASRRR
ncbi:MAG: hypothetical protein ACYTGC_00325 [Planctomycetota bacterium]|jgi:hypothetical protein